MSPETKLNKADKADKWLPSKTCIATRVGDDGWVALRLSLFVEYTLHSR